MVTSKRLINDGGQGYINSNLHNIHTQGTGCELNLH